MSTAPSSPKKTSTFREYAEALLIAGVFLGFSNTFVVKTFYIPSASMEETLLVGDRLFVNRFIYGPAQSSLEETLLPSREVNRGDIVIFRSPERPTQDMVKRCFGLPGDVLEMRDKKLFINGDGVDDANFVQRTDDSIYPGRDIFGPRTVPEDSYFCMGDNRENSHDSRAWGYVPKRYVKGRALMIYWSYGGETSDGQWRGWAHRLGLFAKTIGGFFTQTRWSRCFTVVQ